MLIDGTLQIPYGSYLLPNLYPMEAVPDSIRNHSQIYYVDGDYDYGELGLSLDIKGKDSTYFRFIGFRKKPPVIHSALSWKDELQNYIINYRQLSNNFLVSVNAMYHFDNYHLPLSSGDEFNRILESFHGALDVRKKWQDYSIEIKPAFQLSHINNDMISTSTITLWNDFLIRLTLNEKYFIFMKQNSKILMIEKDNQIEEIAEHTFNPMIQCNFGNLMLDFGFTAYEGSYDPEINILYLFNDYYLSANHNLYSYFEPVNNSKHIKGKYFLSSFNIGYIGKESKIELGIFQITTLNTAQLGIEEKLELDFSWMTLSQRGVFFYENNNYPINAYGNLSIFFSPPLSIFPWEAKGFQPFIGVESHYFLHSNNISIKPDQIPIYINQSLQALSSHIVNIETGILINQFKFSFRRSNLLQYPIRNSNSTKPLQSINELVVEWQFWN